MYFYAAVNNEGLGETKLIVSLGPVIECLLERYVICELATVLLITEMHRVVFN